jgi:ABC-type amino acid transport system permease subunit
VPRPEAEIVKLDPYSALAGAGLVNVTVFVALVAVVVGSRLIGPKAAKSLLPAMDTCIVHVPVPLVMVYVELHSGIPFIVSVVGPLLHTPEAVYVGATS